MEGNPSLGGLTVVRKTNHDGIGLIRAGRSIFITEQYIMPRDTEARCPIDFAMSRGHALTF